MPISPKGTFFVAGSGPGTAVAQQGLITAFSDTGPLWVINNRQQPGASPAKINLAYLRLKLSGTAPTATVSLEAAVRVDVPGFSKLPTNANQYTNPATVNVDAADVTASIATVYAYVAANAMVTPASSGGVRQVANGRIPTSLGITGDEYVFQFGASLDQTFQSLPGLTATRATAVGRMTGHLPPVFIGGQQWATIYLWWLTAATTAPSWEWELGWWEL